MCTVYIRTRFGIILSEWSHLSRFHIAKREGGGVVAVGALAQPSWWLSNWLQSQSWEPLCSLQDPLYSLEAWCFPSSSQPSQHSTPLSHPHGYTNIYTSPEICCIFMSSSGATSWCYACRFFWSDSHALWRAVEGWMGAQSAIAFINTNSYARCSQVSISSQCSFSLGVNAHFWQLGNSLIPFSLLVKTRIK